MATTHFPTQVVLKEYSNDATLNITKENQEADVYWVVLKSYTDADVHVNLYKPCLIEIYFHSSVQLTDYNMALREVKYANSFSISVRNVFDPDERHTYWAKVYL